MNELPSASAKSRQSANIAPWRVLIVDDHPIVRKGYCAPHRLAVGPCRLRRAASAAEAMTLAARTFPHLAIVDIRLQDSDGLELVKRLRAARPHTRLLVISALDEDVFSERVIDAGGHGYVSKGVTTETLIEAIRTVLRGELYLNEQATSRLLKRRLGREPRAASPLIAALTDRELQMFRQLGDGLSTQRIAAEMHLSPKTVERYRENIKAKLRLTDSTALLREATQWVLTNRWLRMRRDSPRTWLCASENHLSPPC